jgi:hypothetical protein
MDSSETIVLTLLLQLRRELTELHNGKAKLGKEIMRFDDEPVLDEADEDDDYAWRVSGSTKATTE